MNRKVLNFDALEENLKIYSNKKVCAMVKANAYGHGVKEVVSFLKDKVEYFGVCSFQEALEVRKICDTKILIVSPFVDIEKCKTFGFEFFVQDLKSLEKAKRNEALNLIHLKINTGMNRFGFNSDDKVTLKKLKLFLKDEKIAGICTHFSETSDKKITKMQYKKFLRVKKFLGIKTLTHLGGSGVIDYKFDYDMIRVGIGLYNKKHQVMQIESRILDIKNLNSGKLGYDGRFEVKTPCKIAIVPIGYADGLPRLSSGCFVEINEKRGKIVGNVCMDVCFVDVTNVPCRVGDKVNILPNVNDLAKKCKTSEYEVFTNFNNLRER